MMPEEKSTIKETAEKEEIKIAEISKEFFGELNKEIQLEEIEGLFKTVNYVPTVIPRHVSEQIVIYKSGTTYRIYAYISDSWQLIYDSTWPIVDTVRTYVELAPVAKAQSSIDNWEDWDLSASIPSGAYAAEIQVYHNTDETGGVRKNGSAISNRYMGNPAGYNTMIVILDSGRIIETYQSTTNTRFWLTGYWV